MTIKKKKTSPRINRGIDCEREIERKIFFSVFTLVFTAFLTFHMGYRFEAYPLIYYKFPSKPFYTNEDDNEEDYKWYDEPIEELELEEEINKLET
jgi:hypothetical protein